MNYLVGLDLLPAGFECVKGIPPRKIAAIRYSGSWSKKKCEVNKTLLEEFVNRKGLRITGEDLFARYDPPFQLWFLRRNEVLLTPSETGSTEKPKLIPPNHPIPLRSYRVLPLVGVL